MTAQRIADLASAEFRDLVQSVMAGPMRRVPKTQWRRDRDAALKNPSVRSARLTALHHAIDQRLGPWINGGREVSLESVKEYLVSRNHWSLFNPDIADLLRDLGYEERRTSKRRLWVLTQPPERVRAIADKGGLS
jgi:hypothetical protein